MKLELLALILALRQRRDHHNLAGDLEAAVVQRYRTKKPRDLMGSIREGRARG